MDELINKLSDLRSQYNCFDENEEPFYRALSDAIRILSQRVDGDTISRQAAIDALSKAMPSLTTPDGCSELDHDIYIAQETIVDDMRIINDLPSARPSLDTALYSDGFNDGYVQCKKDAQPGLLWTPVTEGKPKDGEEVLVYLFDRPSPYIAWIEGGRWYTEEFEVDREYEPLAWMSLPEPWKRREE